MDWRQLAYWNGVGATQSFQHPLDMEWLGDLEPEARVLDFGCGWGRNVATLAEHRLPNAVGVDFAEAMIAQGRARHPKLDLRLIEGLPLAEPDAAFDAALLIAVLTCIPGDEDQREVVAELKRLLKPGGLFYVSDYPLQTDLRSLARYKAGVGKYGVHGVWDRGDGGVFRHHEDGWFDELLSGFEIIERRTQESVTMGGNPAQIVQILARKP
jgi:SAM-dependent methyltransferase